VKRPLLLVLVGAVLIGLRVRTAHEAQREVEQQQAAAVRDAAADSAFADSVLRAAEDIGAEVEVVGSALPAPVRDANEIRLALEAYAAGTYIGEMFAERDSMNYRWPERVNAPLAVWVQTATLDPEGATLGEVVLDVDDEQRARHQLFDRLSPQLYMAVARVSWASLASSVMPSRIE